MPIAARWYTGMLCLLAIGMPNLNLVMSLGGILLAVLWLVYPGPVQGIRRLADNPHALLLVGLYALHFLWLFNSADTAYAMKDIRVKLPLLLYPVVIGSLGITASQLRYVLIALGIGVCVAMIHGSIWYLLRDPGFTDFREIVRGISHIRFSLMAVLVYAALLWYWREMPKYLRVLAAVFVLCLLLFFNLIQSATGAVLVVAITTLFAGRLILHRYGKRALTGFAVIVGLLIFGGIVATKQYYSRYFVPSPVAHLPLASHTVLGHPYAHNLSDTQIENGNYIFRNICNSEIHKAWHERSSVAMDTSASDPLYPVLIRYMSSKGLAKDYEGLYMLTDQDIQYIEMGFPGVLYAEKNGFMLRYHTFLYGYHLYANSGFASGLSFFQRVVYWQAALNLIGKYFWLGTGTGDVKQAFKDEYADGTYQLQPQYMNRAHNQFLTFFVSFGIAGFLYFIFIMLRAYYTAGRHMLYLSFLIIATLSFLAEDTLETQAGATFFAFFYMVLYPKECRKTPFGQ